MDDGEIERRLNEFDFSVFSPVREKLLQELLALRRRDVRQKLYQCLMTEDELDEVAAAAGPLPRASKDATEKNEVPGS